MASTFDIGDVKGAKKQLGLTLSWWEEGGGAGLHSMVITFSKIHISILKYCIALNLVSIAIDKLLFSKMILTL